MLRHAARDLLEVPAVLNERFVQRVLEVAQGPGALRWLPELLEALHTGSAQRVVRCGLAVVEVSSAQREQAVPPHVVQRLLDAAVETGDPVVQARAWLGAAKVAMRAPAGASKEVLDRAVVLADAAKVASLQVESRGVRAMHHIYEGDLAGAKRLIDDGLRVGAGATGAQIARLYATAGLLCRRLDDVPGSITALTSALSRLPEASRDRCMVLHRLGQTHAESARFEVAEAWWDRAVQEAHDLGLVWGVHQIELSRTFARMEAGTWEGDQVPVGPLGTDGPLQRCITHSFLAFCALDRGETTLAGAEVARAEHLKPTAGTAAAMADLADGVWRAFIGDPRAPQVLAGVARAGSEPLASWAAVWCHHLGVGDLKGVATTHPLVRPMLAVDAGPAAPAFGLQARLLHRWLARQKA